MASLVENAVRIKNVFNDILASIKGKGIDPTDDNDVSTYADAITLIPSGESMPLTKKQYSYGISQQQSTSQALTKTISHSFNTTEDKEVFVMVYASLAYGSVTMNVYLDGVLQTPIATQAFNVWNYKNYSFKVTPGTRQIKTDFIIPKGTSGYTSKSEGAVIIWIENK